MIARQLFHAVRNASAFFGSSYKSATSLINVPRELELVSENRAKKESISPCALMALFLYDEIEFRNCVVFKGSFCSIRFARSITSLCLSWRACSCGVRSVCERSRLLTACVAASTLTAGRGTDIPAGGAAGVNWPPKVRVDTD